MEFSNQNANKKRKLSQSKDHEKNVKRKNIKNNSTSSCFGRCCSRKKHDIISNKKDSRSKAPIAKISLKNENIHQPVKSLVLLQSSTADEKIPSRHLQLSQVYNETTFCQEEYDDPCIECTVQYGPDTWENIPILNKQALKNNQSICVEQLDASMSETMSNDHLDQSSADKNHSKKELDPLKSNVNSFVNNIIGDGVDRISEILTTNSRKRKQNNGSRQQQYPGLVFEKQNMKKMSPMSDQSAIEVSLNDGSSQSAPNDDSWNLPSNKTTFEQKNILVQQKPSQNREPYNWDYQEYHWSSPLDLSEKDPLIDKPVNDPSSETMDNDQDRLISDNDSTDLSYSIASVVPANKLKKTQSRTNDQQNPNSHLDTLHQKQTFSTHEFSASMDGLSNHQSEIEHNEQEISSRKSIDRIHPPTDQPPLNTLESNEVSPSTTSSIHSSHPNTHNNPLNNQNDKLFQQSEVAHEQDYRFSSTSISDLFKQIFHTKKQQSSDLDSVNTGHSIPLSVRPSTIPENKNDQPPAQSSILSTTESKQLENSLRTSSKPKQSHSDNHEKRKPETTDINNISNPTRSMHIDIMNPWRQILERLLNSILPSKHHTEDVNPIDLSSASLITSNTYSWSTLFPIRTINTTQYDNVGPWWGRRDADDRAPATFIFANESLNTSDALETMTNNKRMCISLQNRPCCSKYYYCSNTCHNCYSSLCFPFTSNSIHQI